MKLTNIGNCNSIDEFVNYKLNMFNNTAKDFEHIFDFMFTEPDNVMAERTDGYRIIRTTYGQCRDDINRIASALSVVLSEYEHNSIIGIYMANSLEWIEIFWALLMCGYKPLLMNVRLDDITLNNVLEQHNIAAVISDGKEFNIKTYRADYITGLAQEEGFNPAWADELIVMSSGTSENIKLCVYTGESFYYQLCNSAAIIKDCKEIKTHYEGNLKLLTFLPFYHIFGLAAMYMWFGFFSRTFVFLNDLGADTILNTVRKHKVTHIFAVPLLWNKIYEAAIKKIKDKGDKTYKKFLKGLKIAGALDFCPALSKAFSKAAFKEVRANIFGDSICFLIAGGSNISSAVLGFFNGIGYHIADGFGMSEIGITSVETSNKAKIRNSCSVGKPFMSVEYSVSEEGELLVRGNCTAYRIIHKDGITEMSPDKWFHTRDMAVCRNGRYYIMGRRDDMIVCKTGENLNPNRIEGLLDIRGAKAICLISNNDSLNSVKPVLIAEVSKYMPGSKLAQLMTDARKQLAAHKLDGTVNDIVFTTDSLMEANDFKLNRHRIAKRYAAGEFRLVTPETAVDIQDDVPEELLNEVKEIFAVALNIASDTLDVDAHFFFDLNGSSLDYLAMLSDIQKKYEVSLPENEESSPSTVREFCRFIQNNI